MLRHYGNMRAQIVTPLIAHSRLVGAVSVHDLCRTREWTSDEKAFALEASRLLGLVAGLGQG
ncbi:MAG: GAF domain-containing protein [Comamonadaceae bacterium]|nr:MAG: GAF domain-containing protein [Comamonadaceae bacterium]